MPSKTVSRLLSKTPRQVVAAATNKEPLIVR
jgi:hypothetical protein